MDEEERQRILAVLKEHNHAFCPVHERPYALAYNHTEKAGTIEVCSLCQGRLDRQDRLWLDLIK